VGESVGETLVFSDFMGDQTSIQVRKRHFEPFLYKNDPFAKTGSGQT